MPAPPLDARIAELREEPGRTWGLRDAALAVLAVPVVAVVGSGVALGLRLPEPLVLLVVSAALAAVALLVSRRPVRQSGGWRAALGADLPEWSDVGRIVVWTVGLVLAQTAALSLLLALVPPLRDVEPQTNVDVLLDQPLPALLLLAVVTVSLAPLVEEVLFRGVALRGLMLRVGFWPAAVVSTLLFAVLHVQVLEAGAVFVVVSITTLGLGLCVLARRTGRLGPGIGVHVLYNAAVLLVTVVRQSS
jgi:uncharacterized protein